MDFTLSQQRAIKAEGHNILVSASAGSGKTSVLTERVLQKLRGQTDSHRLSEIDRLLILTFTEAAAKEMKERIQQKIRAAIKTENVAAIKKHLLTQQLKLGTADISTIDSFCLKFVQTYYYKAKIDPGFSILADSTQAEMLREQVWDSLSEELYGSDAGFLDLAANFFGKTDEQKLYELVMKTYDFANVNPNPQAWLQNLASNYHLEDDDFSQSSFFKEKYRPLLLQKLRQVLVKLDQAFNLMLDPENETMMFFADFLAEERAQVKLIEQTLSTGKYEEIRQVLAGFTAEKWPNKSKGLSEAQKALKKQAKDLRDQAKKQLEDCQQCVQTDEATLTTMFFASEKLVNKLGEVVQKFSERYQAEKLRRQLLEFNDLEHYTYDILAQNKDIRADLRARYDEIMVDEYQDTNKLQESILQLFAKEEPGNMFMVGDVKQSIYQFRLADPTLFLEKYARYADDTQSGERIILKENFRSVANVAQVTNLIFSQIMDQEIGEIAYDDNAQLVYGSSDYPTDDKSKAAFKAQVMLYYQDSSTKATQPLKMRWENQEPMQADFTIDSKAQGEMMMVAQKIKQMQAEGYQIYDRKLQTMRPVKYSDFAILSQTRNSHLILAGELEKRGIPYHVQKAENYFKTTEISLMLSLLEVIDNPRQDIPLVAVLRSPLVGLNENELALLRINDRSGDFYQALQTFIGKKANQSSNPAVYEKVTHFLDQLTRFRTKARQNDLADLIWDIYEETGFLEYVTGMPGGRQRALNLHALYDRAASYEKSSFKGLFQFIYFIKKMQEKDDDLASVVDQSGEDQVQIMTIHASKGLQFPIVFLIDMNHGFNKQDQKNAYLLSETDGIGIDWVDEEHNIKYETPVKLVVKKASDRKLAAEKMRLLYVAITRAEQVLVLTASYDDQAKAQKVWEKAQASTDLLLNDDVREQNDNFMAWVLPALARTKAFTKTAWTLPELDEKFKADITLTEVNQADLKDQETPDTGAIEAWLDQQLAQPADVKDTEAVKEMLLYKYPHEALTKTAAYQSVSEIKTLFADPDQLEMSALDLQDVLEDKKAHRFSQKLGLPNFMTAEQKVTGAQIGTATHLIFKLLDLSQKPTSKRIEAQIEACVANQLITPQVAAKMSVDKILHFYDSALGQDVLQHQATLKREQPFSMLLPANMIFNEIQEDDPILIHGIVDGYFETDNGFVLFDYKTDQNPLEDIKKKYAGQLRLYEKALQYILKIPAQGKYLYSLSHGEIIEVD